MRYVEADLRKMAEAVVDKARRLCIANSVHALIEVIEGEPRYVLCNAAEKHHADLLVVGSHGYGAIKRSDPFMAWPVAAPPWCWWFSNLFHPSASHS